MIQEEDVYKIGYISRTHGLQGEVNFHFTDDVFDITDSPYLLVRIDGIIVPFFIESYRFRSDNVALVKFDGYDNVEKSQRFIGCDVLFERSIAEESISTGLSLDFFIGYRVVSMPKLDIGTITAVDTQTDNYLFLVENEDGVEYYIPAQESFIANTNHENKILYMKLPDGILDL